MRKGTLVIGWHCKFPLLSLVFAIVLFFTLSNCKDAQKVKSDMVFIQGGTFWMGTNKGFPYEGPRHKVALDSFWMDRFEVSNRDFKEFVEQSGYITEAQKYGWAGIFDSDKQRWVTVEGANWRYPEGPDSSIEWRMHYPVVQVSWNDARAYAKWSGKRLPTEAEWEWAARGGLKNADYPWGNTLLHNDRHMANIWQGTFPLNDRGADGFKSTSPIGSFPPNGYGIHDMAGNVWEWTGDWFSADYYRLFPEVTNPLGPDRGSEKVIRGGSWICSTNYCTGYRVAARQHSGVDSGLNNLGFRCVK